MTDQQYTKARFWKCALQVNPAGYIEYRGQQPELSEDDYNQALLEVCQEQGIKVLGIADHGSVDGVDAIRNLMSQHDIVVFPGFEISSSEKVHFVCLFSEDTTSQQLERYLGCLKLLDPTDGVRPSELSATQLISIVNGECDGFIYAAHCTNDNGVLKKRFDTIWKLEGLKAAQISGTVESLKSVENDFYRKVLLNKDENYKRDREVAILNAKDVEKPETLANPQASCLIKMTKPCFVSFKQAFLDPESRIRLNSDVPETFASSIESVRFIGGYLDEINIDFSDHLNAIIGGRGTGKSTLLECIRFALDLQPVGRGAQKQHNEIIKENLGKERGFIELTIRSATMNGRRFTVSRRYGDLPTVKDEQGNVSSFSPKDLLPRIEIFGQNEIYEITQDETGRRHLLDRFLNVDQEKHDKKIDEILDSLLSNRETIISAQDKLSDIEANVSKLPKLLEQEEQFKELGLEEKLKVIPRLESEKRIKSLVEEELKTVETAIKVFSDSLPDTAFLSEQSLKDLPHAEYLKKIKECLDSLKTNLENSMNQMTTETNQAAKDIDLQLAVLCKEIDLEDLQLESAFKEIPSSQGKTGREIGNEYQVLLREIERVRPMQITKDQRKSLLTELYNQRKSLLAELSEKQASRSVKFQKVLKKLNKRLTGKLKLTIDTEGNREPLLNLLTRANLDGIGPKRLSWVTEHTDFSPATLAETIRQGSDRLKATPWNITPTVADALVKLPVKTLLQMEELELPDSILIELNIAHAGQPETYRELGRLSNGQQCTAILHLLLLDNRDPLILDQPEDNLDNAFIADRIVSEIRKSKLARQFIFATHNANIPVFGDAEWIGVFNVLDGKASMPNEQQGGIDIPKIQVLAANILEGGKSAFNQRREKYGFE